MVGGRQEELMDRFGQKLALEAGALGPPQATGRSVALFDEYLESAGHGIVEITQRENDGINTVRIEAFGDKEIEIL